MLSFSGGTTTARALEETSGQCKLNVSFLQDMKTIRIVLNCLGAPTKQTGTRLAIS